jgi:hypothetical protein
MATANIPHRTWLWRGQNALAELTEERLCPPEFAAFNTERAGSVEELAASNTKIWRLFFWVGM